jgi:hypothetical protein
MGMRYPEPITPDMLVPADENAGYPRYDDPADWVMGAEGNDVDTASASHPAPPATIPIDVQDYGPYTQADKAEAIGVEMATDITKDYGDYTGETGRDGTVAPDEPYEDASVVVTP